MLSTNMWQKKVLFAVEELLEEYSVSTIRLEIGGDRGKPSFRLCFCIVIKIHEQKKTIYKTKSIVDVYLLKEEGLVL